MEKCRVIIDTDPGVDDTAAVALSLYDDDMNIELITTVSGNLDIDTVTRNALHILEKFKREDIPLAKGSAKPMVREPKDAKFIHQNTGMGNYEPPHISKIKKKPIEKDAVEAMYDVLLKYKDDGKVNVIMLGPHTNLGYLLKKHPDSSSMIKRVYCEGCAPYGWDGQGRWKHYVSFNASSDPEAFDIVVKSGVPMTIVPSRMGRDLANFTEEEVLKIADINDVGNFIYQMYSGYWEHGYSDKRIATNDTCAVLICRFPELFTTVPVKVEVDTFDIPGRTVMEKVDKSNIELVIDVDKKRMHELYINAIKKLNFLKFKTEKGKPHEV